jgi:hypothetical protein
MEQIPSPLAEVQEFLAFRTLCLRAIPTLTEWPSSLRGSPIAERWAPTRLEIVTASFAGASACISRGSVAGLWRRRSWGLVTAVVY